MGDEMLTRDRLSRIYYRGRYYDYPLKPMNALRNLGLSETVLSLASYAKAKVRPHPNPPFRLRVGIRVRAAVLRWGLASGVWHGLRDRDVADGGPS